MQVSITFRHMDASQAIRDHIDDQISHLEKYLIKPSEVHVILSVEKKIRHRCEIVLMEQHFKASADVTSDDMYKSIDKSVSKIQSQVSKQKKKLQEHHKHHQGVREVTAIAEEQYQKEKEDQIEEN
jgi:putative sigma-54 modulation protein